MAGSTPASISFKSRCRRPNWLAEYGKHSTAIDALAGTKVCLGGSTRLHRLSYWKLPLPCSEIGNISHIRNKRQDCVTNPLPN